MSTSLRDQLELVRAGNHPRLVADLKRCAVLLSENQGLPGWCVMVYKKPEDHLSNLSLDEQMATFREVALVAHAIRTGMGAERMNYACYGNVDPQVHWHVIPRYKSPMDPDPTKSVWLLDPQAIKGSADDAKIKDTMLRIRAGLGK